MAKKTNNLSVQCWLKAKKKGLNRNILTSKSVYFYLDVGTVKDTKCLGFFNRGNNDNLKQ